MGLADIIPGISGGTIAFITHIYERLIQAVTNLLALPQKLYQAVTNRTSIQQELQEADTAFLALIALGALSALALMSFAVDYLFTYHPQTTLAFFIGLILAASATLTYELQKTPRVLAFFILGALLGYAVTLLPLLETTTNLFALFALGSVAITAMLLPGISGGYILLIAGQYETLITALQTPIQNLALITVFATGCLAGAAIFSHAIRYVLTNYYQATIALLTGLMLGALNTPITNLQAATTNEPLTLILLSTLAGILLVSWLEYRRRA